MADPVPAAGLAWRPMRPADLPAVLALAGCVHRDHPERPEVFAERLRLAPEGCLTLDGAAGALMGYALSHPWGDEGPPPLDSLLGGLPARPACWHVHDIALRPEARGQGLAGQALGRVLAAAAARGVALASLVAVAGKAALWARHGFQVAEGEGGAGLASYGPGASLMRRRLAPGGVLPALSGVPPGS